MASLARWPNADPSSPVQCVTPINEEGSELVNKAQNILEQGLELEPTRLDANALDVCVGGTVTGSAMITGDNNITSVQYQPVSYTTPKTVEMRRELNALREILGNLSSSDGSKIGNAFADAIDELNKPQPDKNEVGKALDRAFDYANKDLRFASVITKLRPHLTKTVSWLGEDWYKLLRNVEKGI